MKPYANMNKAERLALFSEEYTKKERSFCELAQELGTYPNKLRRDAIALGVTLRNKSASQAVALKTGRIKHPTKGLKRGADTKVKISEGKSKSWEEMPADQKKRISDMAKQQWKDMDEDDKKALHKKASEGIRLAAKEGSKLEKYMLVELIRAGFYVEFHKEHLLLNERLQLDLFLPKINVAIEIDGPSHFEPIWGDTTLQRNKKADGQKNGLLLSRGLVVVRIKQSGALSEKFKRDTLAKTVKLLKEVEANKPPIGQRYFEL